MEYVNDDSITNIPKAIRDSIERNFICFCSKEIKTVFRGNDPSAKMKSFIRIYERIVGFEGKVVPYHNKVVNDKLLERIDILESNDYMDMKIQEDLLTEFKNTLISCRKFLKSFTY